MLRGQRVLTPMEQQIFLPSSTQRLPRLSLWTQCRQRRSSPEDRQVEVRNPVVNLSQVKKKSKTTAAAPFKKKQKQKNLVYLCKGLLAIVLQVLGVDVEVIVVDGERLGALGDARHKLLHFKEDSGLLADIKLLHGNVGWGNTICGEGGREGGRVRGQPEAAAAGATVVSRVLLVKSGATLSMVTSRFPRMTGSLAIFSGLPRIKWLV